MRSRNCVPRAPLNWIGKRDGPCGKSYLAAGKFSLLYVDRTVTILCWSPGNLVTVHVFRSRTLRPPLTAKHASKFLDELLCQHGSNATVSEINNHIGLKTRIFSCSVLYRQNSASRKWYEITQDYNGSLVGSHR